MLKQKDTDSFGVELSKIFAQSFIGAAVGTVGIVTAFATLGAVYDFKKKRAARKNPAPVTPTENP